MGVQLLNISVDIRLSFTLSLAQDEHVSDSTSQQLACQSKGSAVTKHQRKSIVTSSVTEPLRCHCSS